MGEPRAAAPERVAGVDVVRGVAMILMALDHTRDFFGIPGQNPTDLASATAALFLTRWVTHICAPVFFLLAGTGARLSLRRQSVGDLSRYLVTRGLWLIVLELVVVRCLVYQFNMDYRVTMLLVLWALGWAMIALSALARLPSWAVTAVGAAMILGHNLFDGVRPPAAVWTLLHAQGVVAGGPAHVVFVAYPLVPWMGVTAVGYGLGQLWEGRARRRQAVLLRLGVILMAAFLVVRGLNGYGDPAPWQRQPTPLFTVLSFLNTTKYPPSLAFLLMTLGPALVLLRLADDGVPRWLRPVQWLGRVPLFYYVGHFLALHVLAVAVCYARYGSAHWMFESPDLAHYPVSAPPGWGYALPAVYGVWALVVVAMYPLCRWFAEVKRRSAHAALGYL